MRTTANLILIGILLCVSASNLKASSSEKAADLIKSGTETQWGNGTIVLKVTERNGPTLRGIQIEESRADGLKLTYSADEATVSPGKPEDSDASDFVTIEIRNAKVENVSPSGERLSNVEDVTLILKQQSKS
jgi:hypothetical protein